MPINDLASGGTVFGPYVPEQIFAGEAPKVSGNAVAITAVDKYQVLVLTATGLSEDFTGITTGDKCVIAAQSAAAGDNCPYFSAGHFNHAMLIWPAAQDTFAKRRAFFAGTPIHVGQVTN